MRNLHRTRRRAAGLVLALGLVAGAPLAYAQAQTPAAPDSIRRSQLGDVVYSVLAPELFAKTHEGRWLLLDGGLLPPDSALHGFLQQNGRLDIFGPTTAPPRLFDARGRFIRGLNLARDPTQGDPAGPARAVGSDQADQIGQHTHPGDRYGQFWRAGRAGENRFNAANQDYRDPNTGPAGGNPKDPKDVETRPKNIALFVYIKVD